METTCTCSFKIEQMNSCCREPTVGTKEKQVYVSGLIVVMGADSVITKLVV